MSRYVIPAHDQRFEIIVGWDAPLSTFVVDVIDRTVEDKDAACVLWLGAVQAITTVAALQHALQAYATLPPDLVLQLEQEQAASRRDDAGWARRRASHPCEGARP